MLNHKLSENVCLAKVRSVLQYIIMPQTDLTVLIHMIAFKSVAWIQSAQYWIQCQTRVNKAINLWVPKQRISYYKLVKKDRLALIQSCARFEAVPAVTTKTSSGMWRRVVWKIYKAYRRFRGTCFLPYMVYKYNVLLSYSPVSYTAKWPYQGPHFVSMQFYMSRVSMRPTGLLQVHPAKRFA